MRIHLTFTPKGETGHLPINYNSYISEFVYELLQPDVPFRANPDSAEGVPFYTFSNLYIPEVQQEERTLHFGKVAIELSISLLVDPSCEAEVAERIRSLSSLELDPQVGTGLLVSGVEVAKESNNLANSVRFRMLSPLASPMWDPDESRGRAGMPEQRYIHYADQEFSDSIRGILLAKYERWKGKRPNDTRFRFTLDENYVQRRRGRISKLVTFHEGEPDEKKVKAIVAPFEVKGNPELIWLGYVAGFGEKNLLGFGCADIVGVTQSITRNYGQHAHNSQPNRPQRNPALERQFTPQRRPGRKPTEVHLEQRFKDSPESRQNGNNGGNTARSGSGQRADTGERDSYSRGGGGFRPR